MWLGLLAVAGWCLPGGWVDCLPSECSRDCELWLVSTREAGCDETSPEAFRYWECQDGAWRKSSWARFAAAGDSAPTAIFVHGNWIDSGTAFSMGPAVRASLAPRGAGGRAIVWSWPSSRKRGRILPGIRENAGIAETEGRHLAAVLAELETRGPLRLVGYSFGARVITSALHRKAQIGNDSSQPTYPVHAALLAPAVEDDWLLPGHRHGLAATQLERLLVLFNPRDPHLKRYRVLTRQRGSAALGFLGLRSAGQLPTDVRQQNSSGMVGPTHDWRRYLGSTAVRSTLRATFEE